MPVDQLRSSNRSPPIVNGAVGLAPTLSMRLGPLRVRMKATRCGLIRCLEAPRTSPQSPSPSCAKPTLLLLPEASAPKWA